MNSIEQINSENGMASQWGLLREISPSFGARLVQERYRLHFLSDRAGFIGEWTDHQKAKEGANKWVVPSPLTPCHI
ncbi:type IV toxin-antitoxin system YeeU family antitoxin [Aeromonas salmonicida]|uniref:type IV toxin-antitoxin system YeeU family antitoxin n=1 Tax=Aeromonas salmonicida TaxID=645 RepID=UPI000452D661|nr:type IV toxin-antitoxin system YeeU family antitoxin [Aeromonas salmonicida]ASI21503.1 hypothetical protein CE456_01270 [Aeromonas salmonicida]ASI25828.1 hypothetical protein CE463_01365 [Aeromonas salmonicida]ASI29928.1 hypothetical protein CE462_00120 [Aeromonas salmonicida]MDH7627597.1 type IV toxin-antitoxin system YeeU family antitoxin [Aeromonas salmonicida]TNI26775.1 hypothetical protein CF103_05890 [Aeromonas salmonicida]